VRYDIYIYIYIYIYMSLGGKGLVTSSICLKGRSKTLKYATQYNIVPLEYQSRISRIADRNSHQSDVTFGKYRDVTKQSVLYQKLIRRRSFLHKGVLTY
jgi:hypothetical protein